MNATEKLVTIKILQSADIVEYLACLLTTYSKEMDLLFKKKIIVIALGNMNVVMKKDQAQLAITLAPDAFIRKKLQKEKEKARD